MEIKKNEEQGALVLTVSGEIDMHFATEFRKEMFDAFSSAPNRMIIDMAGIEFIDSSGIATLVEGLREAKAKSTEFILCSLSEKVRDIFELARLETIFKIVENKKEALSI